MNMTMTLIHYGRFTSSVGLIPLGYKSLDMSAREVPHMFTAIISVSSSLVTSASPVFSLLTSLASCPGLHEVLVLWSSAVQPPPVRDWRQLGRLPPATQLQVVPQKVPSEGS